MTAPATTALGTPTGAKLKDGFSTRIAFAANANIRLWVKTIKPPGIDGGEKIDITDMHNTAWRTFAARQLKTLMEMKFKAAYDPGVYDQLSALVNVEGAITIHFPNGATVDFYGYLMKAEPADNEEGKQPEMDVTVQPTNYDPVAGTEEGPNYKTASGTDTVIT